MTFFILLFSFGLSVGHADSKLNLTEITAFNEAYDLLNKEQPQQAEKKWLDFLTQQPFSSWGRFHLARSYFAQKKFELALKEYESVIRQNPIGVSAAQDDLRFRALFNAAITAQELKKVDLALQFYQSALEVKPDSIEVKTNIELLDQQGGGGGSGENQNQQQPQDQGQQPQPGEPPPQDQPKEKGVAPKDVKDILEELERQEQKIRALEYGNQKGKEKEPEKDW